MRRRNDSSDARKAAQGYVTTLGKRDGAGTCALMTKSLQQPVHRRRREVRRPVQGPHVRRRSCRRRSTRSRATSCATSARAKISDLKLDGDSGTFRYTLGTINVDGRVAKENGDWKVSCCVPGSG